MHALVKTYPKPGKQRKTGNKLRLNIPLKTYDINQDIIIAQQSLPSPKYQYLPFVDVSKKFEESLEKCRKKQVKIKAIESIPISKKFSDNIIENYRKSQLQMKSSEAVKLNDKLIRNRCSSESNDVINTQNVRRASELVDQLLLQIYGRSNSKMFETEYASSTSCKSVHDKYNERLQYSRLVTKDVTELQILVTALKERVKYTGNLLVKHLKKREALNSKQEKICNVITAHLHAYSRKLSEDTNMRFSPSPVPGDSGFNQWRDAMKMVAKLPGGIPPEFRRKLWLALAEKHLQSKGVNWNQTEKFCFNEWSNPDDSELGIQIVKDLHRTGCSLFCGAAGQENQALLKRVLLAYARWNKSVGYCQGFNMLAALILQVMDKNETDSVKVMIYLIEGVLPESYFANNLRGLSVDMIVFRDLLKLRLPTLSKHLEALQNDAREGNSYEPPLTNVFTMQWFLTLFCNCLPQSTVLRVWDLIFLEGNEILLRTAIAIWEKLSDRILAVNSADEFYSIMGVLTREMLEFGLMDSNTLIKSIVNIGACPELNELRDKYLYNITPWTQSVSSAAKKGFKLFYSDDDDQESDYDEKAAVTAAYGISIGRRKDKSNASSAGNVIQPYAHGHPDRERLALDISALKKQYAKLRERQRQAHIILQAACARQPIGQNSTAPPIAMNHLLLGKNAIVNSRGRRLGPPKGAIPPARTKPPLKKAASKEGETILWKDTAKVRFPRKQSLTEESITEKEPPPVVDSDSSSYSDDDSSSTSTELCDEPGRMSDFDTEDKINELPVDKKVTDTELANKNKEINSNEKEFAEIVADINTLKSDDLSNQNLNETCKENENKIVNNKVEEILDIQSNLESVNNKTENILENIPDLTPEESKIFEKSSSPSEELFTCKSETDIKNLLPNTETSLMQENIISLEIPKDDTTKLSKNDDNLINIDSPSSNSHSLESTYKNIDDFPSIHLSESFNTESKVVDNEEITISSSIPEIYHDFSLDSTINLQETSNTDEIKSTENLINLNEFEPLPENKFMNENEFDSNIEFESFLQERIKLSKENSEESIKSPQEQISSYKSPEEKFRRHKSYEETTNTNLEKTPLCKQKSFDIHNLPIIETTIWKPYGIEEESPKEEIAVNTQITDENELQISDKPNIIKQTSVDLLTVEDKRFESGRRNSERALKIIQENSMILHRILLQQKSSEKEDSEDELSRSPISKTFLRSESLLSKDEKTDEERSSKDGEEEFLESGVESFSVSPALIEEESDRSSRKDVNDEIEENLDMTNSEKTILPDSSLIELNYYSVNKDEENNSVIKEDSSPRNYNEYLQESFSNFEPSNSTIFDDNSLKIEETSESNNVKNDDIFSEFTSYTQDSNNIKEIQENLQNSKESLEDKQISPNEIQNISFDTFSEPIISKTLLSPEQTNYSVSSKEDKTVDNINSPKIEQNIEDLLLNSKQGISPKPTYSLLSPIEVNTNLQKLEKTENLLDFKEEEFTSKYSDKTNVSPDKDDYFRSITKEEEIKKDDNTSKTNVQKFEETENLLNFNQDEFISKYLSKTTDTPDKNNYSQSIIKEEEIKKDDNTPKTNLQKFEEPENLLDFKHNEFTSKYSNKTTDTPDKEDYSQNIIKKEEIKKDSNTSKTTEEEMFSFKSWQSSRDIEDKTFTYKKEQNEDFLEKYKLDIDTNKETKDSYNTFSSKKDKEEIEENKYKLDIDLNKDTKETYNTFSSKTDNEEIEEKTVSFYDGKYYTDYIDKLKEGKIILDELSPLEPSRSKPETSLFLDTNTLSNTDEKTKSFSYLHSPDDFLFSSRNKYPKISINITPEYRDTSKDFLNLEKKDTDSYRDSEDYFSISPKKTNAYSSYNEDIKSSENTDKYYKSSISILSPEETVFTKKDKIYESSYSHETKRLHFDDKKEDKSYFHLESPDDKYSTKKNKESGSNYAGDRKSYLDDKKDNYNLEISSSKSSDNTYSSTSNIDCLKYNEDKTDNNIHSSNTSSSSAQNNYATTSSDIEHNRKHLSIDLKTSKTRDYSPEISPPKHLSCLQFTTFQADIPCTSKAIQLSPICSKEKATSPCSSSPTKATPKYLYSFNLPTLSPPRRTTKSPASPDKTFNPFPVQPTTRQPKELGVRLGLYKDLSPLKSPTK